LDISMPKTRPTVADLLALKGERQLTMLRVMSLEEAEACEAAGIELLSVPPELLEDRRFRDAAPSCFVMAGLEPGAYVTTEDYLRAGFRMLKASADAVYCAASLETIARLRAEGIPVCGHVGLIPSRCTWTGGFRAVGKTADSALEVYRLTKRLEAAGAFAAEIEVVPAEIATEISKRTSMFMISMGAGGSCDAQYLFAEDVLGSHSSHYPRHSKVYRNFRAEYDRLQRERIAAFSEYRADVEAARFPGGEHTVAIAKEELAAFLSRLEAKS
jgi:3-methyl-2-oxobutanoate hydroxymethyltransferase